MSEPLLLEATFKQDDSQDPKADVVDSQAPKADPNPVNHKTRAESTPASKEGYPVVPQKLIEPFKIDQTNPWRIICNPCCWCLGFWDFLIWALTIVCPVICCMRCCKRKPRGVLVGAAWRNAGSPNQLLTTPNASCKTVHDVASASFKMFAHSNALGTRKYLGEHMVEGAKHPLQKFGPTSWISYKEFGQRVLQFGIALRHVGLKPQPHGADPEDADQAHTILIFEETCAEWMTACIGSFGQSISVATSYATLGMGAVAEAINETGARLVLCNIRQVAMLASIGVEKCPSLAVIVYTTNKSTVKRIAENAQGIRILSFDEFLDIGQKPYEQTAIDNQEGIDIEHQIAEGIDIEMGKVDKMPSTPLPGGLGFTPPSPENLAVVMYTSGSTGKPKGVMIKHRNMVASIAAMRSKFEEFGLEEAKETHLAYLPAAHIMELVAEMTMISLGGEMGFACPKTISSKGACRLCTDGSVNTTPSGIPPAGAIQEFKPTIMAAVPKIWDVLKKGVEDLLSKETSVKQWIAQAAFTLRAAAIKQCRDPVLLDLLVFNKLAGMLGGRIKVGVSGGGPISQDVQNFIRVMFKVPLVQGYALTETCCAGAIQTLDDMSPNIVGPPVPSVEIKLRSCVNAQGEYEIHDRMQFPYRVEDRTHYDIPCRGRGEILIRGPSVSVGYFKQPEKTQEVFLDDGWFSSGDVGIFLPDGRLMVVDRLKNLVKLKGGEYIAIESMEKEYSTSIFVDPYNGGIMCYGDGEMDRPIALVQANMTELTKLAKSLGIGAKPEEIAAHPTIEKMVLENLVKTGKSANLGHNELLCGVILIPGTGSGTELGPTSPWTPENGGLTASNKLNRKPIEAACADSIAQAKTLGTW